MLTLHGVALSLLLSWGPTNGFDPTSVYVLREGAQYSVDGFNSSEFETWLRKDLPRRVPAVRYFVACAFKEGVVINFGNPTEYSWAGAFGLATSLNTTLAQLVPAIPPGSVKPGSSTPATKSARLVPSPDDGKWVSACLMALSNMADSHQYVLLRGNPPAWINRPSEAELWTMGYPEGVFFADLLNFNVTQVGDGFTASATPRKITKKDLEKSYTLSLDLPENYLGLPDAGWAPPNASIGRTLDFAPVTHDRVNELGIGRYRVAQNLGTYETTKSMMMKRGEQKDPVYVPDEVCVDSRHPTGAASAGQGIPRTAPTPSPLAAPQAPVHVPLPVVETHHRVVACNTSGAQHLHPLFVHAPRVVGLATAASQVNASLVIQAVDTGVTGLRASSDQRLPCQAGETCTGRFQLTSAGQPPVAPGDTAARTLIGLGPKQSVTVVLRREPMKTKGPDPLVSPEERFTAIVRYRASGNGTAGIEVSDVGGGWRQAGSAWPSLPPCTPTGWRWMQVYPVFVVPDAAHSGGKNALMIRISGPVEGESNLEFDLAGFVSGPPWCLGDKNGTFAGTCPDDETRMPSLRRGSPRHAP